MTKKIQGSVMLVGGGISSMQAALDLADSGYLVHMVEKSPAIGGVMAQLDKTFPTNDCAMCIMSPVLVEVGRHINIDLMTCTEVESIEGSEGDFTVKLKKTARYVDPDKCTSCGDCAEACPVVLPNEYEQGLADRKATYKKYIQAIPGAFAIQKGDKAPCRLTCPAGINVHGYVQMVGQGKYKEAIRIIMEDLPLPGVLGRVCPHPCEEGCRRAEVDQAVAIRDLKRLAADKFNPADLEVKCSPWREEKVAIIGSGPAGLSAAYQLSRQGIKPTVYEALPKPGGMLRVGIPDHRLPPHVLDNEIRLIENLGVEIKCNAPLGPDLSVEDLMRQGYKAVFLALGAHRGMKMGIDGEDADGVRQGVDFLRQVNLEGKAPVGKKVAIVGGGNVAIDVARCAVRLGAEEVKIIYRRTRNEMPAWEEEINAAEVEGVQISYLTTPVSVNLKDGKVVGLTCIRMELGEPDESGRRRPAPIEGSEYEIAVDMLIPAIGQSPDLSSLKNNESLSISRWNTIEVNPVTFETGMPGVFAGGDVQTGPDLAISAIAAGKKAAESIVRYLDGKDMVEGREELGLAKNKIKASNYRPIPKGIEEKSRLIMPELPVEKRFGNFDEVELGFSEEDGKAEASRCVNCGYCCECYQCVEACKPQAITPETHCQKDEILELNVGSVILAPGYEPFDPSIYENYSYAAHPNVVSAIEFERFLSASGPTEGRLVRPSDHKEPKKIAWFQCVGSRDINKCDHSYCSSVCCMYAIKEAVIAKEHAGDDLECVIFYMDMRTHGKDFERSYNDAKDKYGVRFVRSRIHTVKPVKGSGDLEVRYIAEDGAITNEVFDEIVLSIGLQTPPDLIDLANRLDIKLSDGNFCETSSFSPVETSRKGIYVCGAFQGPRDIPQSVVDASAAAAMSGEILAPSRGALARTKEEVVETNVYNDRPRIGVFVCQCGINIAGVVNVPTVRDYAAALPYVEYATDNLFTCSQDTQDIMAEAIRENKLNRVVVAACTPKTHEPLFQETLANAGLNKYLFEFVNIRNHGSWVHKDNPESATEKSKDLLRMAVMKVALKEPLQETELQINQTALVIGGGVSGIASALSLARQGFDTHLVERSGKLGGQALNLYKSWKGEDIQQNLAELVKQVESEPKVEIHLETKLAEVDGFVGNFKTALKNGKSSETIEHGVSVIATGGAESKPSEYLHGSDPRVITAQELDRLFIDGGEKVQGVETAVFIQCVGSREPERPYCSRICCAHSVESALELKKRQPDMQVFILYRDIRTYGERETLYQKARKEGVIFIQYTVDNKPKVTKEGASLQIKVTDHILGVPLEIDTDLLVLASAIIPNRDEQLARFFKIPVNSDGFYVERHAKLGPSDFATDGVFLCGLAHYPKSIDESIAQGKAAASRAVTLLARKTIFTNGEVASVNPMMCSQCGTCVSICPYSAPSYTPDDARMNAGKAQINPALCKGCGLCVASCRSGAIGLKGFDNNQIFSMIQTMNEFTVQ